MQLIYLFISVLLSCYLISTQADLVRAPITRRPRQNKSARKLSTFNGSMSIGDFGDFEYGSNITIGSNNQSFIFQLDTGSATMWIPGNAEAAQEVGGKYFDCSASSTCVLTNDPIDVSYGKGAIYGSQMSDQIQIGGLTIPSFEMVLVSDASDMEGHVDGLIGLGLTRDPNNPLPTVLETLKQHNLIDVRCFSMYLGFDPSASGNSIGEIIFGGYDPQYALSDFSFVSVEDTTATDGVYWQTTIPAIGYGWNQNLTSSSNPVMFDSGTSLILLYSAIFDNFIDAATAQGVQISFNDYTETYTLDCSDVSDLEPLTFFFDGTTLNISSKNYVFNIDGECSLALSAMPSDLSDEAPIILGDTFLANFYVLYTAENYTVGLADGKPFSAIPTPNPNPSPENPTTTPTGGFPIWAIILIVLGSILIITVIAYLFIKRKRRIEQSEVRKSFVGTGVAMGGASFNGNNLQDNSNSGGGMDTNANY